MKRYVLALASLKLTPVGLALLGAAAIAVYQIDDSATQYTLPVLATRIDAHSSVDLDLTPRFVNVPMNAQLRLVSLNGRPDALVETPGPWTH